MREIVLDTETTGFDPDTGDRIVEIGAVELMNHLPTGRTFHVYINPERPMPQEAFEVHGLGDDFLRDKPRFAEVAADFVAFVGEDARLVIHNAQFDMKFLNWELRTAGYPVMPYSRAVDTLEIARGQFPGAQNSLDALCRRFRVDNSNRTLHGALLDSELLAEVYLALRGGRQPVLVLEGSGTGTARGNGAAAPGAAPRGPRPRPLAPRLTAEESEAHAAFVAKLGEKAVWLRYSTGENR
ncbi:DNA polymerase-3 subunit epsilon [Paracoccus aminovorans]|uniref:DNA polymerase III subunit epsilon n=1 Tax=Paracoccus aminovorans TaxID=34004 RepID=A0A1I3D7Y3_9RHOB|nr:DNA polymerase III subunit epsilon [Paracoccus aminovorans]CQR84965.1 DNA polymerase III subunit epsilon [Paracoccus aminovorans]SFH82825.1 DNA polymerase-3 subunit epsilon [Paracoccus aminovorans]